jgi:hypothetical protein
MVSTVVNRLIQCGEVSVLTDLVNTIVNVDGSRNGPGDWAMGQMHAVLLQYALETEHIRMPSHIPAWKR